jgi:hypothetical protein
MAKKGSRAAKATNKPAESAPEKAPAAKLPAAKALVTPKPDVRRWIYGVADIVFTIGYLWVFTALLHNRFGWARAILYILPLCTLVMAIGTLVSGRGGWIATIAGGAGMLLWTVGFIILLLVTASYLAGVYGAFGKAAASGAILSTAFVVQFAATLPALQLKWAMTRGGRRAFGLAPIWPRPAAR